MSILEREDGVVVTTHDIDAGFEAADRIAVLCVGPRAATFQQRETTPQEAVGVKGEGHGRA